ncbi:hypothetical protein BGW80DRAFT_1330455 [Lactifluus volemus]|nr:hypothetical protein BGW80DRAFT_1330455 [Lactifluus volemus]
MNPSLQSMEQDSLSPHIPPGPKRDYSLKEGETFTISIPGRGSNSDNGLNLSGSKGTCRGPFVDVEWIMMIRFVHREITITTALVYSVVRHLSPRLPPVPHLYPIGRGLLTTNAFGFPPVIASTCQANWWTLA